MNILTKHFFRILVLPTLFIVTSATQAGGNSLATVYITSGGINVSSTASYGLAVTVSGPGDLTMQKTLPPGEDGYLQSDAGLPDGYYRYEISVIPNGRSEVIAEGGETSDGRSASIKPAEISGPVSQTGGFRLMNGAQLDSSQVEKEQ